MLISGSRLLICDNSGGILGKCIHVYNSKNIGFMNDILSISLLKLRANKKAEEHVILKVLIVKSKCSYIRKNMSIIKYNKNSGIILKIKNKEWFPLGNRFKGYLLNEIRKKKFSRIILLSRGTI